MLKYLILNLAKRIEIQSQCLRITFSKSKQQAHYISKICFRLTIQLNFKIRSTIYFESYLNALRKVSITEKAESFQRKVK